MLLDVHLEKVVLVLLIVVIVELLDFVNDVGLDFRQLLQIFLVLAFQVYVLALVLALRNLHLLKVDLKDG